jgi:hypothetical protein
VASCGALQVWAVASVDIDISTAPANPLYPKTDFIPFLMVFSCPYILLSNGQV